MRAALVGCGEASDKREPRVRRPGWMTGRSSGMMPRWIERLAAWVGRWWQRAVALLTRSPREVLDPDIREVFLSELDELTATLVGLMTSLRESPTDAATLHSLRRAFHTIKGSGLMAGALTLAGVCGRLERLAVQLIEGRMTATAEVLSTLEQAVKLLPECRRSIEAGASMPPAMAGVGLRVKRLLNEN